MPVTRTSRVATLAKAIDLEQGQVNVVAGGYSSNGNARKDYDHASKNSNAHNQSLVGNWSPRDSFICKSSSENDRNRTCSRACIDAL